MEGKSVPQTARSQRGAPGRENLAVLIQGVDSVVPVEVKAERNLKAKSLAVYRAAHSPALSIRTSLAPHLFSGGLLDLPLPAIGAWRRYVAP